MKKAFALLVVCAALFAAGCAEKDTVPPPAEDATTTTPAEEAPADATPADGAAETTP
jgi:hypothetical protein